LQGEPQVQGPPEYTLALSYADKYTSTQRLISIKKPVC